MPIKIYANVLRKSLSGNFRKYLASYVYKFNSYLVLRPHITQYGHYQVCIQQNNLHLQVVHCKI